MIIQASKASKARLHSLRAAACCLFSVIFSAGAYSAPEVIDVLGPSSSILDNTKNAEFTVFFDQDVQPQFPEDGSAFLQLRLDSGVAYAEYKSYANNSITFSYTPSHNQFDADGLEVTGFYQLALLAGDTSVEPNISSAYTFPDVSVKHGNLAELPKGGLYLDNDKLIFRLSWGGVSQVNLLGGTPQLQISVGDKQYMLNAEANANGIDFVHQLQPNDLGQNGVKVDAFHLNNTIINGSIDSSIDYSSPNHILFITNTDFTYQNAASGVGELLLGYSNEPVLLNIDKPKTDQFNAGDILEYTLTFTGKVNVSAEPSLLLSIDGQTVEAQYTKGTGSNTLVFTYQTTANIVNANDIQVLGIENASVSLLADNGKQVGLSLLGAGLELPAPVSPSSLFSASAMSINKPFDVVINLANSSVTIDPSNFSLSNAELTSLDIVDGKYVASISPLDQGEVLVELSDFDTQGNDMQVLSLRRSFDTKSPMLTGYGPSSLDGAKQVSEHTIELSFNENIAIEKTSLSGFVLSSSSGDEGFSASPSDIMVNDSTVSLSFDKSITPGAVYQLTIEQGALTDIASNLFDASNTALTFVSNNNLPLSEDDYVQFDEDNGVLIDVLLNDNDPESYLALDTLAIEQQPMFGDVTIDKQSGKIMYVPYSNTHGDDAFSYTVADEQGARSLPAVVQLRAEEINDLPRLVNAHATPTVFIGQAVDLPLTTFDADGDIVSIELLSGPKGVSLSADNHLIGKISDGLGMQVVQLLLSDQQSSVPVDMPLNVLDANMDNALAVDFSDNVALLNESITLTFANPSNAALQDDAQFGVSLNGAFSQLNTSENCTVWSTSFVNCYVNAELLSKNSTFISITPQDHNMLSAAVDMLEMGSNTVTKSLITSIDVVNTVSSNKTNTVAVSGASFVANAQLIPSLGSAQTLVATHGGNNIKVLDLAANKVLTSINSTGDTVQLLVADMNNDARLDVVVVNKAEQASGIYFNNGDLSFTSPSKESQFANSAGAEVGDFDNDGYADIVAFNNNALTLYKNEQGALTSLAEKSFTGNINKIKLADIDADGKLDLVISDATNLHVYFNAHDAFLKGSQEQLSDDNKLNYAAKDLVDFEVADFNGDGAADIVIASASSHYLNGHADNIKVLTLDANNKRLMTYASLSQAAPSKVNIAYLDDNTSPDLLVSTKSRIHKAYINDSSKSQRFASFQTALEADALQIIPVNSASSMQQDLVTLSADQFGVSLFSNAASQLGISQSQVDNVPALSPQNQLPIVQLTQNTATKSGGALSLLLCLMFFIRFARRCKLKQCK